MQLSKNFSTDELACPCCKLSFMDPDFVQKLQVLRDRWGRAILVSSGYRCEKNNKEVGGVPGSLHIVGRAVDCMIVHGAERFEFVKLAFEIGFRGIGIGNNFVHLDTRDSTPVLWKYTTR